MSAQARSGGAAREIGAATASDPGPSLGLVRVLDRDAQQHRYAVGRIPPGELVGELGSCHSRPTPGSVPLWLIDNGRYAVTDQYRPVLRRPLLRNVVRWTVAPATWSDLEPLADRLRSVGARATEARQYLRPGPLPAIGPLGRPVGFLNRVGDADAVALYAGVHPVNGDQILTRDQWELVQLGYVDIALLGFLQSAAPLTGRLSSRRPRLPWASRYGEENRSGPAFPQAEVAGEVGVPHPGHEPVALPFLISGWAIAPAGVSAVEVAIDGRRVGRARIGLDNLARLDASHLPDTPVSRFEFRVLPSHLPPPARRARIGCTVRDMEGAEMPLREVTLELLESTPDDRAPDVRAAELRDRAPARRREPRPRAGDAMKLLVFTHDLGYGGAQLYLVELLERLGRRMELEVTVVAPGDGPLRDRLEADGVRVHVTAGYPTASVDLYEGKVVELLAWAGAQEFDVAFVNTMIAFTGVDVAGRLGIPTVFSIHESYDPEEFLFAHLPDGGNRYVRERGRRALASATAVIFQAEATRRQYLEHGDAARFLTLPYGVERSEMESFRATFDRSAARRSLGVAEGADVLLCLGTIEHRKAQSLLAKAFSYVADAHPDALLLLVGRRPGDPYAEAIEEYARRVGLRGRIRTIPLDPEPYKWHAVADVLVCPSDLESLPRVVLEAMAFETPVLASDVFGLGELIEDGKTGYLCEARDVRSLTDALARVLAADPAERSAIAAAGAERIRSRHDPEAYAETVGALIEGLVDGGEVPVRDLVS